MVSDEHIKMAKSLIESAGMEISVEELAEKIAQLSTEKNEGEGDGLAKPPRKLRRNEFWDAQAGKIRRKNSEGSTPEPVFVNPIKTKGHRSQISTGKRPNLFEDMGLDDYAKDDTEKDKKLWGNNSRSAPRPNAKHRYVKINCQVCNKHYTVYRPFVLTTDKETTYTCDNCILKSIPR